jgi:hypothetical protein
MGNLMRAVTDVTAVEPKFTETYIATGSEGATPTITIPNAKTYNTGTDELMVFREGNLMVVDIDYTETSSTSVTLTGGLVTDEKIMFRKV